MNRHLLVLILPLLIGLRSQAQLNVNMLDTLHASYDDIKVAASGSSIVGLKGNGDFEVRSFSGNDLGASQSITSLTGFYDRLQIIGNYAYTVGHHLKAIDISNPVAPVTYPEILFANDLRATDHWGNLLFSLSNVDGFTYKLQIFTLFYPTAPQRVDTLILPADGDIKVSGNKLYYFWSNASTGDRVRIYTLSNTVPYVSLTDSLVLNQSTTLSLPSLDITGGQLLAKTSDSLYRFRIGIGGNLQLLSRMAHTLHVFKMAAIDTNTLCYADAGTINIHQLHSNKQTSIDSLSGFSFFEFMGKLGNNVVYSGGGTTVLVQITNNTTDASDIPEIERTIAISPNPSSDQWTIKSTKSGRLTIYGVDGKIEFQSDVEAGKSQIISAYSLPSGVYFYRVHLIDQSTESGKLIKN